MLGYSSNKQVFFLLFLSLFLFNHCNEDNPVPPGETFSLKIISPLDSSSIFQTLYVNLSNNSSSNIKLVQFYIDGNPVDSDSLGNSVFLANVSNFADDNFHKVRAMAISSSGASGFSNSIRLKIYKSAKYYINLVSPADNYIERSNNKVELRWLPSRAFSKIVVEISQNYFFNDIIYSAIATDRKHFTPALEAGIYYWRLIVEYVDTSLTLYSEKRQFEIAGPPPPTLLSPINNEITSGASNLTFSWTKSSYAVHYELLVLDDESKDTILYTNINNDSLFTTSLSLSAYSWKMRAKNLGGVLGDWSTQSRFGHGVFYKIVDAGAMLMPIQLKKHTDGNFLILGTAMPFSPYSYITKITQNGLTLWSKRFDSVVINSFDVLNDGSLILAGEKTEIMPAYIRNSKIIKLDASGSIIWESLLSSNNGESVFDIKPTTDGYIAVGSKWDSLSNNSLSMILKVSQTGEFIYRKLFSIEEPIKNKLFIENNDIITLGHKSGFNNNMVFVRYDGQGNELSKKNFSGWLNLHGAKKLTDENLLVGGSVTSNYGMFLKKINTNGDVLLESEFNIANPCAIYDVTGSLNDEYFVTGYNHKSGMQNGIYFGKLGANGVVLKEKQYPGESGYSLVTTDDGGVLILGYINNGVMCIIKTNSDGTTFFPQ